MERPATSLSDNCSLESSRCGPSSSAPMSAPSTSRGLAPKSSSEICTTSRRCAAPCAVARAYFTYPLAERLLEATTIFAAAAKEAGVEAIVNMSQITARDDHPSPAARQHWLAERVLDWSGIGVTHLRPPFFLENFLTLAAKTV